MPAITRSQRYRQIVTILGEEGFGTFFDQVGVRVPRAFLRRTETQVREAGNSPEERVRRTIERLGPTFSKIGQMLSTRPDLIPASYAAELTKLQDEMEPFAFELAKAEIEEEFGEPLHELFSEFDPTPAAAATIGQVYYAKMPDGSPVAVKVQRPDIHAVIEADLDILRTQARRIATRTDLGTHYDLTGLVDEFSRAIRQECDYVHEGENAEELARMFADDPEVHFPKVYWERTSDQVLTLERIEGIPFNRLAELDAHGVDRHEAARRGITCYYEQIFMHGFYHADPHPGNLFAMPDGRVAFTDFGRAGRLSDRARDQVADLLVAIIDQDSDAAVDVLVDVSGGCADVDLAALKRDVSALISKYYDLHLHEVNSRELVTEVLSLINKRGLTVSSEFALLLTTLATLQALGSTLDPDFHFVDSVSPFARAIVEEQVGPRRIMQTMTSTARQGLKLMKALPADLDRALKRIADNDLRVTVRVGDYDQLMTRVEQALDRLAFAVVISAFVIGFSWLLSRTEIPWWLTLVADLVLVGAAGVGFAFFLMLLFRGFRKRPRD